MKEEALSGTKEEALRQSSRNSGAEIKAWDISKEKVHITFICKSAEEDKTGKKKKEL